MIYRLNEARDVAKLPPLDATLFQAVCRASKTLEDASTEAGGFIIVVLPGSSISEIIGILNIAEATPEWIDLIRSTPAYYEAVYIYNNECAVTLFIAVADAPNYFGAECAMK